MFSNEERYKIKLTLNRIEISFSQLNDLDTSAVCHAHRISASIGIDCFVLAIGGAQNAVIAVCFLASDDDLLNF